MKKDKEYKCRYCEQTFESENALNSHLGKMHLKDPTIFKPNEKQIELLKAWADPEQKPTITAVCEKVGIDRSTYYRWFENDAFVAWFNSEWQKIMKRTEPYLDNVGLKKAVKDFRYWEGMQMKYHQFARKEEQKREVVVDEKNIDDIIEKYDLIKRYKQRGQKKDNS